MYIIRSYCSKCGCKLNKDAKFCKECSDKIIDKANYMTLKETIDISVFDEDDIEATKKEAEDAGVKLSVKKSLEKNQCH